MNRTNAQSTLVPDALAMVAACVHSQPLMELAVALRTIVTGSLLLPADRVDAISRITRDLANSQWCLQAHLTLNDPRVKYYATAFCRACIQAAPLTAENPMRDLVWQARVKAALIQDASLQSLAMLLLEHVRLRVTSAQTNPTPTSPRKRDNAELHAKALQFAEAFARRREAQEAEAASTASPIATPIPEPVQVAELPQSKELPSNAEPASVPRKRRALRNVAARPQYTSMPALRDLCGTSTPFDQFRPEFS